MFGRMINKLEEGIISLLLVGMALLVFVEVILRFVFNMGFLWMEELTLLISAWMVLFGASYGIKVGSHIGVDAIVRLLNPDARRIVSMIAVLLCLFYCSLFIYGGWVYMSKLRRVGIELEDLPVERWVAHSIILIGFSLLALRFIQLLIALWKRQVTGFALPNEAADALKDFERVKGGNP